MNNQANVATAAVFAAAYRVWRYVDAPEAVKARLSARYHADVAEADHWARPKWLVYIPAGLGRPRWSHQTSMHDELFAIVHAGPQPLSERELFHQDTIFVWAYQQSPEDWRAIASTGGDEDWLALVPSYLSRNNISWMQEGSAFANIIKDVEFPRGEGAVLRVGSHA